MPILQQSYMSLLINALFEGRPIADASAFVATHQGENYLVTSWHVVAGRHPTTGLPLSDETAAVPDALYVLHRAGDDELSWEWRSEPLYDADGEPLWFEHPDYGQDVDVVALPLTQTDGIAIYAYDPTSLGPRIVYGPSDDVSVIGFPFGRTGGEALGIWVHGTVATEPAVEYDDLPCFLIDSRTRTGQSGSPVILFRTNGYTTEDGNMINNGEPGTRFVGVYSGRISAESDLGLVWKASALVEILTARKRGPLPLPDLQG
jgi:hypothetical protein